MGIYIVIATNTTWFLYKLENVVFLYEVKTRAQEHKECWSSAYVTGNW